MFDSIFFLTTKAGKYVNDISFMIHSSFMRTETVRSILMHVNELPKAKMKMLGDNWCGTNLYGSVSLDYLYLGAETCKPIISVLT